MSSAANYSLSNRLTILQICQTVNTNLARYLVLVNSKYNILNVEEVNITSAIQWKSVSSDI